MTKNNDQFDFLKYLAQMAQKDGGDSIGVEQKFPSLQELSHEYGVSISALREQLGVARALGLVEVRPRTGIRQLKYRFAPAVIESLSYAIDCDRRHFDEFADLRKRMEASYWFDAVEKLTDEDKTQLHQLVNEAMVKLNEHPIRVPHQEHRQLHLTIYGRLENPFVYGIMEAYWDSYEEVGFSRYSDLEYLKKVWNYHRQMVEAICSGEYQNGYQVMLEHMDLIDVQSGLKD